jgi:hypothetical protein
MSEFLQPIPEFKADDFVAAIDTCVLESGVAKIPNLLGEVSTRKLLKLLGSDDEATVAAVHVIDRIPELEDIYVFHTVELPRTRVGMGRTSHVDSVAPEGISLLMPLSGGEAVFAASDQRFDLSKDTFDLTADSYPTLISTYRPGDAMLLRQEIDRWKDEAVCLQQIRHCGAADTDRILTSLDFRGAKFSFT